MDNLFVDRLSKSFRLGRPAEERPISPKQLAKTIRRLAGRQAAAAAADVGVREFWAAKDVSFRVQRGTVLCVIGANGASTSPLLKLVALDMMPPGGRGVGVGRLVSFRELGAGFNHDVPAR